MKTLVAGIGNIFNRDDGFGCTVAEHLLRRPVPDGVRVEDYGIRGMHLALDLLEGYDLLVLIDALGGRDAPGTLTLLEPELDPDAEPLDAHRMDPQAVLGMVAGLGGELRRVLVVGCQPADLDEGIGLSEVVAAAVEPAVRMVDAVLADALAGEIAEGTPA
jgi:hydrogenase maturation protease